MDSLNKSFISIVDDDAAVRRALARVLRASRFDVAEFDCGEQFLDSLDRRRPDCVVLDCQMPGLCAADIQQRLLLARADIPVIVVTGDERSGMREKCLANGAIAFLVKPLRSDDLIASVAAAIRVIAPN
jgi:FixJ family two-component response regulator